MATASLIEKPELQIEEACLVDESDDDLLGPSGPRVGWRMPAFGLFVVGCTSLVAVWAFCGTGSQGNAQLSARMLLESPEFVNTATDQVMAVRGHAHGSLGPKDWSETHDRVSRGMKFVSEVVRLHAPSLAEGLDKATLSPEEKDAVLGVAHHLSDPRVHRVGLDIAEAIQESPSTDAAVVKRHIIAKLRPRLAEIRKLRDEIYPECLRKHHDGQREWESLLHPTNVRVLSTFDQSWRPTLGGAALRKLEVAETVTEAPVTAAPPVVTVTADPVAAAAAAAAAAAVTAVPAAVTGAVPIVPVTTTAVPTLPSIPLPETEVTGESLTAEQPMTSYPMPKSFQAILANTPPPGMSMEESVKYTMAGLSQVVNITDLSSGIFYAQVMLDQFRGIIEAGLVAANAPPEMVSMLNAVNGALQYLHCALNSESPAAGMPAAPTQGEDCTMAVSQAGLNGINALLGDAGVDSSALGLTTQPPIR